MKKPTTPITQPPLFDCGLTERLVRALQHSWLHVQLASVCMSMPRALFNPAQPTAELLYDLTLMTDGARGWLVLGRDSDEWNVEMEMKEFLDCLVARTGHDVPSAFRAVEDIHRPQPGALDLRDMAAAREILEAEFDHHFRARPRLDVKDFLVPFRAHGFFIMEEAEIRDQMSEAA